jgi:predicted N-acetyltransferase YhbS
MIEIKRVTDPAELAGIKQLQTENLRSLISRDEQEQEGFVTAEYSLEFLQQMHAEEPSVIAKDGDRVVGYVLASTREAGRHHALLSYLFDVIDTKQYREKPLRDIRYVVVGQLCVGKAYRGQGLVQRMYDYYRETLSGTYPCCLTDIDEANPRSLKAHLKSGFEILDTLHYEGSNWHIVIWDWRNGAA